MDTEQLLKFYDTHKSGRVSIRHAWTEKIYDTDISLEDLLKLIKLHIEKNNEQPK